MKNLALITKVVCPTSIAIIKHFQANGYEIKLVVVEQNIRKKFSQNELNFRKAHDQFNKDFKKYGLGRRILRQLWDVLIPKSFKPLIEYHAPKIPYVQRKSVEYFAKKKGIPVARVRKHSSQETKELLVKHKIDLVLFGSSNWLIKPPIIGEDGFNILNVHPGKLPDYKGLDSLLWTIEKGGETGCTAFFVDESMDGGDILKFFPVPPVAGDTVVKMQRRMSALKPEMMLETVQGLDQNTISAKPQTESGFLCQPMSFEQLLATEQKLQLILKKQ